jgi:hypothetical protein
MMTDALARIYALRLPNDLNTLTLQEILDLLAVVDPLIDPITGKLSYKGAIPNTYAVAILDITGTVGYGMQVTKALSVGAAIKVINRRFSNKVISAENYDGILSEVRNDFNSSRTGVTLDVGALYRIPKTNLDVAMSLQNIIPTPALDSDARVNTVVYDDAGGVFPVTVKIPFRLTMPFLMNCGANYSLTDGWDASFDWVDIAAQDERFEHYVDRFRLGTEYRLTAGNRALVVAFRGGLATSRPTAGIGFNVYDVFHLDGAYAYDPFFGDYAWYGQVRFGW